MKIRVYAYSNKYHKWIGNATLFYVDSYKEIVQLRELADAMIVASFIRQGNAKIHA